MVGSTISWEGAEGGRARGREQKEEEVLCDTLKCTRPTKSANSADGIAMSELCKRSAMLHTLPHRPNTHPRFKNKVPSEMLGQ